MVRCMRISFLDGLDGWRSGRAVFGSSSWGVLGWVLYNSVDIVLEYQLSGESIRQRSITKISQRVKRSCSATMCGKLLLE